MLCSGFFTILCVIPNENNAVKLLPGIFFRGIARKDMYNTKQQSTSRTHVVHISGRRVLKKNAY